jgi:hypothetical protein
MTRVLLKKYFFFHSKIYTFSVVFHHGGHFVREDSNAFYRGGVQTVVSGETVDDWNMSKIQNLVKG